MKINMLAVSIVTALLYAQAYGQEYSFQIPKRPLKSAQANEIILEAREYARINESKFHRQEEKAKATCPSIFRFYSQVFEKIIISNNLSDISEGEYGFRLIVDCENFRDGAYLTDQGNIYIGPMNIEAAESEDEVAFVISHEIAHSVWGHDELAIDYELDPLKSPYQLSLNEKEADEYGVVLMANAGYSPKAAVSSLKNIFRTQIKHSDRKHLKYLIPFVFNNAGKKTCHGSLNQRKERIYNSIENNGLKKKGVSSSSKAFKLAKEELARIKDNAHDSE